MAHDASSSDAWIDLSPGLDFHIGAYFPDPVVARLQAMTVFWKGELSLDNVRKIIRSTELLYDGLSDYRAFLTSYGDERREVSSAEGSLADRIVPPVDAFRAEFSGSIGDLTLWATLSPGSGDDPGESDENIGICVSPTFFEEGARHLIDYAIRETVDDAEQIVDVSLGRLSNLIRRDPAPVGIEM